MKVNENASDDVADSLDFSIESKISDYVSKPDECRKSTHGVIAIAYNGETEWRYERPSCITYSPEGINDTEY